MRSHFHQRAIFASARLALIAIGQDVLALRRVLGHETPFHPRRKSCAAAPAQPPIKFDVVVFKRCAEIDIPRKDVIAPPGGDSIANHCQTVTHFLEVAYGSTGAPYLLKGEPAWVDTEAYDFQAKVAPEDVFADF